jgi:hypothetical protein
MRTKLDPDDEFFIPDVSGLDWSQAEVGRYARAPGEKTEIGIDGAVGYSLRLIPSNKILARFESTLEAWPVIITTIEGGRSPRTLSLDWNGEDGRGGSISAGPRLEGFARVNNGEPHPYPSRAPGHSRRRVAEGAA